MTTPTTSTPSISTEAERAAVYLRILVDEAQLLAHLLTDAVEHQWLPAARPAGIDTEGRKASGGRPDPTAEVVLDPARLALRDTVKRVERALRDAAITARGSRRAIELTLVKHAGR